MRLVYEYHEAQPQEIKHFVKEKKISKGLLASIKFQGGKIEVNGQEQNVRYRLQDGDILTLTLPKEEAKETLYLDNTPLNILYEDEHFLAVDKPAGVPSVPVSSYLDNTMVNRVAYYLQEQRYENQVVHVITRLDKDTSGVMLFAKHRFAHALMDQALKEKSIQKSYVALVSHPHVLEEHGHIDAPIARLEPHGMRRGVREDGKVAHTEYWISQRSDTWAKVDVRLHTGRTHQIRVHFHYIGAPLLGDALYDGPMDMGIQRQALHCASLSFQHPFLDKMITISSPVPEDMQLDRINKESI